MQITKELFVIPSGEGRDTFILYAPLKGELFEVTGGVINVLKDIQAKRKIDGQKGVLRRLRKAGVVTYQPEKERFHEDKELKFAPTNVTLFPTNDCNLRCLYCYASAGEHKPELMDFETARASIDFIAENAEAKGKKGISVGFHGGGEPFMNFKLMKEAVDYARKTAKERELQLTTSSATNGVLQKGQLEWIVNNLNILNISLDGPKEIQDFQRPLKPNRGSSYEQVAETLRFLENVKYRTYGIRSTITEHNVDKMAGIVELFHALAPSLKSFHFEPIHECGRCSSTNMKGVDAERFVQRFIEAVKKGEEFGIDVYYSGGKVDAITDHFCGASGSNFFVTPTGNVTSCLEVSRPDDHRAEIFVFGRLQDSKFRFDYDKLASLRARTVHNMPYCEDCYAKFSCAGDCPAKVISSSGSILDPSKNGRCELTQKVLLHNLKRQLNKKAGKNGE